jgi:hypothetical protein
MIFHYAECHNAEYHYAECRGATKTNSRLGCKFYKRVIGQNKMNLLLNIFLEFRRTLQLFTNYTKLEISYKINKNSSIVCIWLGLVEDRGELKLRK